MRISKCYDQKFMEFNFVARQTLFRCCNRSTTPERTQPISYANSHTINVVGEYQFRTEKSLEIFICRLVSGRNVQWICKESLIVEVISLDFAPKTFYTPNGILSGKYSPSRLHPLLLHYSSESQRECLRKKKKSREKRNAVHKSPQLAKNVSVCTCEEFFLPRVSSTLNGWYIYLLGWWM